jgi:hypothetical protein
MGYFGGAVQDLSITSRVPYNLTADVRPRLLIKLLARLWLETETYIP